MGGIGDGRGVRFDSRAGTSKTMASQEERDGGADASGGGRDGGTVLSTVDRLIAQRSVESPGDGMLRLRGVIDAASGLTARLSTRHGMLGGLTALGSTLLTTGIAQALPELSHVNSGELTADQISPDTLNLNQGTNHADATFHHFDILSGETVNVFQPSAHSTLTARVAPGASATTIAGSLNANGHVTVINGSGVMFTQGARIDVGSIVATTATNASVDPTTGAMAFSGAADGSVVSNAGEITVREGGFAALVAPTVRNDGVINARLGKVTLASAQSFTVDPYGDRLVSFEIGSTPTGGRIDHRGSIVADGGVVTLDAGALDRVVDGVINMSGKIRARSIGVQNGEVVLGGGEVSVSGEIDATGAAPDETGGTVTVDGGAVAVDAGAVIDASGAAGGGDIFLGRDGSPVETVSIADTASIKAVGSGTAADGGRIIARAKQSVAVDGTLDASGGRDGGTVNLQSGGETTGSGGDSRVGGAIFVDGGRGSGGQFALLGDAVRLEDGATVSATGGAGGGSARIGGGFQGGEGVRRAQTADVAETASVDVSATGDGDGGTLIVWSDEVTSVDGSLIARGAGSGDGGLVETSSAKLLRMSKVTVDAGADGGAAGTWLLDPTVIRVVAAGGTANLTDVSNAGNADTGPGAESWIDVSLLDGAGATVVLAATDAIIFETAVNMTNAGVGLQATTGSGNITVDAGATISTNGGTITFNAGGDIELNADVASNGADISMTAVGAFTQADATSVDAGAATIDITAAGDVTVASLNSAKNFGTETAAITVTSTGGSILDGGDAATDIVASGTLARIELNADAGIGDDGGTIDAIETDTTLLKATNATSNGVQISNTGALAFAASNAGTRELAIDTTGNMIVAGAGVTGNGDVSLKATGDMTVNSAVDLSGGAGALTLNSTGGTGTIAAAVTGSGTGAIDITGSTATVIDTAGSIAGNGSDVAMTGALTINGAAGTEIDTGGGNLTLNDSVTLASGDVDLTTGGGALELKSTVDGTQNLTLDAGAGSITADGAIGGGTALGDLVISDAGTVDLVAVTAASLTQTAGRAGAITTLGGAVTTTGAVSLTTAGGVAVDKAVDTGGNAFTVSAGEAVSFAADGDVTTTGGAVSVSSTSSTVNQTDGSKIDAGAGTIALNAAGDVTLGELVSSATGTAVTVRSTGGGIVDGGDAGTDITATGAGAVVDLQAATGIGSGGDALELDVPTLKLTNNGSGDISVTSITDLSLDLVSATGGGSVTVVADTGKNLTVNAAGSGITADGDLTLTADGNLDIGAAIDTSGGAGTVALAATTGTLGIGAAVTAGGAVTVDSGGAQTIAAGGSVSSGGGDITFGGTLAGALTINGQGTGTDVVDSGGGAVDFKQDVLLATSGVGISAGASGGTITFTGALDGGQDLKMTAGTADFQGAVGGTTALASLDVTADTTNVTDVTTTGAQSYSDAVTLNGGTLESTGGADIDFGGAVTLANAASTITTNNGNATFAGTVDGAQDLIVAAGTGTADFQGAVGGTTALTSLDVTATTTKVTDVKTTGAQTYSNDVSLNGGTLESTGGSNFTFNGAVTLANAASTITTNNGDATFNGTVDGGQDLTVNGGAGAVALNAAVGGTTALASIDLTGATISAGAVKTSGAQSYTGTTTLTGGTVEATGASDVTFTGDVDLTTAATTVNTGNGNVTFTGKVDGAQDLTIGTGTGTADFQGAVGGTTALASLDVTAGTSKVTDVTTTGAQTYSDAVTLNGGTLESTGGSDFTFNGAVTLANAASTITTNNGNATFNSTINGGQDLTVNGGTGAVALNGAAGGTTALASIDLTGNTVAVNSVTTSGDQSYTGATTLNGTALTSTGGGTMTFGNAVTLASDVTVTSNGGAIDFNSTIDGAKAFQVASGGGTATFGGNVGGTTALTSFTQSGNAAVGANNVTTTGNQTWNGTATFAGGTVSSTGGTGALTFGGVVTLDGATTTNFAATGSGAVAFNGNITGTTAYAESINVDGGTGTVSFNAGVGTPVPLKGVTATTGGTGTVNVGSPTAEFIDVSTAGGAITFTGTIDLAGPTASTVDSNGGDILVAGGASITTDADLTLTSGGGDITQLGNVTFGTAATYTLDSGNGDINITGGAIDGPANLVSNSGNGDTVITGVIGGTTPLTSVDITGENVTVDSVTTTGAQTYTVDAANGGLFDVVGTGSFVGGPITVNGPTQVSADEIVLNPTADVNFTGGIITLDDPYDVLIYNNSGNDVDVNIGGSGVGTEALPFGNLIVEGVNNINIAGSVHVEGTMQLYATYAADSSINVNGPVVVGGNDTVIASVVGAQGYDNDYTAVLYAGTPGTDTPNGEVNVPASASLTVSGDTLLAGKLDVKNVNIVGDVPFSGDSLVVGGTGGEITGLVDGAGGDATAQFVSVLPNANPNNFLINGCVAGTVCDVFIPPPITSAASTPVVIDAGGNQLFSVMKYEEIDLFEGEDEILAANYSNTGNAEIW